MASRIRRSRVSALAAILAIIPLSAAAQSPTGTSKAGPPPGTPVQAAPSVFLEVAGDVAHPLSLSAAEFAELPRKTLPRRGTTASSRITRGCR